MLYCDTGTLPVKTGMTDINWSYWFLSHNLMIPINVSSEFINNLLKIFKMIFK